MLSDLESVTLNQSEKLAYLIGFRLSSDILEVNQFRHFWMHEDVMTPFGTRQMKSKRFDKAHHIREPYVLRSRQDSLQQLPFVHRCVTKITIEHIILVSRGCVKKWFQTDDW
jgi:hypothetical protein